LVGLIFLPFATIMFCLVYSPAAGGVVGANWIWVALGLLLDIMSYGSGGYGQRSAFERAGRLKRDRHNEGA